MRPYLVIIISTLVAGLSWIFALIRFDPLTGGWIVHSIFYAGLALALQGTFMLGGIALYTRVISKNTALSRPQISIIARPAFLLTTFIIILLALAARDILKWWNIIPLAILFVTVELFFISLNKRYASK